MFLAVLVLGSATALASAGSSPLSPSADYLLPGAVRRFTLIYTARVSKQAGPPLNYFIEPYAEVDGKPVPAEKAWSYRELD